MVFGAIPSHVRVRRQVVDERKEDERAREITARVAAVRNPSARIVGQDLDVAQTTRIPPIMNARERTARERTARERSRRQ